MKSQRNDIEKFISETFGDAPEYLWAKTPNHAVFRHQTNQKWYAVLMEIPYNKLCRESNQIVDIINLKCDQIMIGSLLNDNGFYPAYHMSKTHWISIVLDGSVELQKIKALINISYELTDTKIQHNAAYKA